MKKIIGINLLAGIFSLAIGSQLPEQERDDQIFQVSVIEALNAGQFDGLVPYAKLKAFGDFGLGTFDHLNGEMIALDGAFFQVKSDGVAYPVKSNEKTPFADITFFKPDQTSDLAEKLNYEQLRNYLLTQLPDKEGFYAIRIEGNFQKVITRSVPQQEKPYPTLAEAIEQQVVFEYTQMEGTMVGIYMPQSAANEGIPGFHFHFISKDKTRGGHLLDCTIDQVRISLDVSNGLSTLKGHRLSELQTKNF